MKPIPDTKLWGIQEVSLSQLGKVWVAPFSLSWSLEWAGLARLCLKRFEVELQTKWGLERFGGLRGTLRWAGDLISDTILSQNLSGTPKQCPWTIVGVSGASDVLHQRGI